METNLRRETPLHLAAREGHMEVVKALITTAEKLLHHEMHRGVNYMPRKTSKEGDTALHEAVRYHHSEVVKTLIQEDPEFVYGANFKTDTPLYMAAKRGYGDLVDIIIDKTRTSPAHTGYRGRTALHAAVVCRNREIIAKLLEWKPDLTKQVDEDGWSPLHRAAHSGYPSIVEQLLEKSLDKSVVYLGIKYNRETALHIAARRGNTETVKVILSYCPDCCEQVDYVGHNVLHFAMMGDRKLPAASDILKENSWLRVRGIVNERDSQGTTPLSLLASENIYHDLRFFKDDRVDKMELNDCYLNVFHILSRFPKKRASKEELREIDEIIEHLTWIDPMEHRRILSWRQTIESKEDEEKLIPVEMKASETHLMVSALIAAVTFVAGFIVPCGYKQDDDDMTMLSRKAAFKAFIVTDTIAVMLSLAAVIVYFFMAFHYELEFNFKHLKYGFCLTLGGMIAMVAAFMTGLYAVLPLSSGLPILTCIVCCCFLFAFYFGFRQMCKTSS